MHSSVKPQVRSAPSREDAPRSTAPGVQGLLSAGLLLPETPARTRLGTCGHACSSTKLKPLELPGQSWELESAQQLRGGGRRAGPGASAKGSVRVLQGSPSGSWGSLSAIITQEKGSLGNLFPIPDLLVSPPTGNF